MGPKLTRSAMQSPGVKRKTFMSSIPDIIWAGHRLTIPGRTHEDCLLKIFWFFISRLFPSYFQRIPMTAKQDWTTPERMASGLNEWPGVWTPHSPLSTHTWRRICRSCCPDHLRWPLWVLLPACNEGDLNPYLTKLPQKQTKSCAESAQSKHRWRRRKSCSLLSWVGGDPRGCVLNKASDLRC
jgi:hypothetical protein